MAEFESPRRSLSRMDIEVAFNTLVTGRKMAFRMSRFVRVSRVIDGPALLPWRILNGGRPAADIKGLLGLRIVNEVVKMWPGNRSAAAIHRGRCTCKFRSNLLPLQIHFYVRFHSFVVSRRKV